MRRPSSQSWVWKAAEIFNSLSYQKILGYSPEEFQESSEFEQIHPEDRGGGKNAAKGARRTGTRTILEYRFRHKNGDWMVLESVASVMRNENGEPEKLVIVNRDITEHKRCRGIVARGIKFLVLGGGSASRVRRR